MRNRVSFWCVALALSGCLRDPDPGGQEGEEFRGSELEEYEEGTDLGLDTGTDESSGTDDGGPDLEETDLNPDAWVGWAGSFVVERGLSTDPTARDCVLRFEMDGTRTDTCADCLASFSVTHEFVADDSLGREVCTDPPDRFTRDYILRASGDDAVALYVHAPDDSEVFYGIAAVTGGTELVWSVGSVAVPSTGSEGTLYRTDVEQGVAQLD
jgi:hypothetical protein